MADSPRPVSRMVRRRIGLRRRSSSRGRTCLSNMGRISRGGPGRRAILLQDLGPLDDIALFAVRGRRGQTAAAEPRLDEGLDLAVENEPPPEDLGQRFPRPVVLGGTEPSHAQDETGTGQGGPQGPGEIAFIVADDGFKRDFDPDRVQSGGQEKRVRVLEIGGQELRADGNDLCLHRSGLKSRAAPGGRPRPPRVRRRRRRP